MPEPAIVSGMMASLGTGLATAVGALPVLGMRRLSDRGQLALLAFAGGIMLAASVFSLILPGIAAAQEQGFSPTSALLLVLSATLGGALFMALLGAVLPVPEAVFNCEDARSSDRATAGLAGPRSVWLLVLAITLHNIPEGAAVGMAYSEGDTVRGLSTAVAIGTQNLPEGLAVACALVAAGMSRGHAFVGGALSGAVEPIAGTAAAVLVTVAQDLLPWGLALAAGAMLLIVCGQIMPDIARNAASARLHIDWFRRPVSAFACGLVVMCFLDIALG